MSFAFIEDDYRRTVQPILDAIRPVLKEYLDKDSAWVRSNMQIMVDGTTVYLARVYYLLHSSDIHVSQEMVDYAKQKVDEVTRYIRRTIQDFRRGGTKWALLKTRFDLLLTPMIDPNLPKDHPSWDDLINYIRSI